MAIEIINGPTIAAGESLSDAVDCSAGQIVRLTMPGDWLNAPLTFQISSDGLFFNDVFDNKGIELKSIVVAGTAVIVPADYLAAASFIKFRSGTRDLPVTQPAERVFAIALEVIPGPTTEPALRIKLVP
ncbi:hypothetical protein IVB46_39635 [Bradyrhizobium sp. 61]|uniref:hypothetical protein n=1 Tax=unclassified Bradyrhizobium TaxID=2631580 RepID=UPI001FF7F9C9|nr:MULTISPECIES: hypothetical protein [unclassified Bradyrhizobium]MCK1281348.1 hypothetical protein [Bradyrhizobium sp. 61]MCK1446115.1 hypothetical protein [Bradyrhizobium sp. 48]MCK1461217.1 hypothetical protein [Bradyrhizobium sp. 2]